MSEFLQPKDPAALAAAIERAQTPSELREAMVIALQREGSIVQTVDQEFNERIRPNVPPAEQESFLPANGGYKYERTIRFHESTGRRALVIRANSEADLSALEAQILGY